MSDFERVDTIRAELAGYLTRGATIPILAASVVAVVLAATVYHSTDALVLGIWLAAVICVNAVRLIASYRHEPSADAHWDAEKLAGRATLSVAVSGILWGFAGGYFFDTNEVLTQVLLAFVIGGLAAGSLAAYSAWLPAFYAFTAPALIPVTIRFYLEGDSAGLAMGAMLTVYGFALASLAHTVNRSLTRTANLEVDKNYLVQSLTEAKFEAESANRAKDEFLSRVSHELRTPMNAILGYGQLLSRDSSPTLSDRQRRSVEQIMNAGHHLLDLIDDVLKLGQISTGTIEIESQDVPIGKLLDECIGLIEPEALRRQISVENRAADMRDEAVVADRVRIKEVIINLLSNAVKYNVMQGRIVITANRTANNTIKISVADTGPGVPSDKLDQIFEPFTRLESSGEDVPGTGIGLTIAKQLMELMNGTIACESTDGNGTEFWIELPAANKLALTSTQSSYSAAGDDADPANSENSYSLLYVEDNETNQELLRDICALRPGISLQCANDAESGLDVLRHRAVDMVIMDIKLPGIDGFEALRRIREHPTTTKIPVIALSASAMPSDIKRGTEAGFRRYLTKPIDIDQILSAVDDVRSERPHDQISGQETDFPRSIPPAPVAE